MNQQQGFFSDNLSMNLSECCGFNNKMDPISFRTNFLEGSHHIHVGHFASIPIVLPSTPNNNQQQLSSNNNNQSMQEEETNLMASVDGTTCFLDQEFQDCKNRLLMQSFFMPKASIINISNCGRKEVQNFIKMSKSISILDKANEEVGVGKNEFAYLSELWNQMFKLPQTMLKYSGKHESFWRGIFSTLYRFITRDYEQVFDENRDFQWLHEWNHDKPVGDLLTSSSSLGDNVSKIKLDSSFFIGFNHQRNTEIRELTRRIMLPISETSSRLSTSPQTSSVVSSSSPKQQKQQFLEQAFLSGTLLPFFASCESNDITGNQYQAENELSLMLQKFIETQYSFFQNLGSKTKKRHVTGVTCVGPIVTCFVMRRYHTVVDCFESNTSSKKSGNTSNIEPIYVMQPLDTFNLANYDDLLRCAKYFTGVRKLGEALFVEVRNALRHLCGLPLLTGNHNEKKSNGQQPANENSQSTTTNILDSEQNLNENGSSSHMGNGNNEKVKNSAKSSHSKSMHVHQPQGPPSSPKATSRREEKAPSSGEKRKQPPTSSTAASGSNVVATAQESFSKSQSQKKQKVHASTGISPERTTRQSSNNGIEPTSDLLNTSSNSNTDETSQRSTQQDSTASSANDSERMVVDNTDGASSDLDE
ncbi:hypothetical protein C9374_005239 [Naegleria lovaniensis]|uniref:Uncharacterized protein n=1 Tax=Naegleria lovaniensis TaxID=51637 RepID=A0AA88GP60_NAELO|nr:uncharacterized protein C9374_005239 [Naegleria lovaniensis]KAG2382659.1 hypothetical protein C9374_005239 [Naegleria lovaniensis]